MKKKKHKTRHCTETKKVSRKIRLGYLSSDFGTGRTRDLLSMYFSAYDKERYEIYAYHAGEGGDAEPFAQAITLREIGTMTSETAADVIRRDRIALLVDLSLRAPSDRIRAIMAQHPAPHIISLAADCPEGLADVLPQVEGTEVPSWCYTPFRPIHQHVYRAPLLDAGTPTFGIVGTCMPETAERLMLLLCDVLRRIPAVRLVLPAQIAGALTEGQLAHIAAAGSEASVLDLVDELPYDMLDLVLGVDVDFMDVCLAATHSVPLLVQEADVHGHSAVMVLERLGLAPVRDMDALVDAVSRLCADPARLSEYHGSLHWQLYDLSDMGEVFFFVERAYERVLAEDCGRDADELNVRLANAAAHKDWAVVIAAAHTLDGMDALTVEQRMSLAWAYFFLDATTLAGRWALLAEGISRDREGARLYLSVIGTTPPGTESEIYARACHGLDLIAAGLPAVPDVRATLCNAYILNCTPFVGAAATAEFLWTCAEEAVDPEKRRFYYSASIFFLNAVDLPAAEVYRRSLVYGTLFPDAQQYTHTGRRKKEKIRIGYISGDFCAHVMQYFIWPFLAGFDPNDFEVYAYSLGKPDQYSEFFQTLVTRWRDLTAHKDDPAYIAREIYADEIDILFDLAGHTTNSGLAALAYKPAPIQLSGLGYMATTGLPAVDYFVTDHYCDPVGSGSEDVYVEKLLRLTSQFCYNGHTNLPASAGTPARTHGYIQFASFNQYRKLQDPMLLAWREIMERVPNARLLLKNKEYNERSIVIMARERLRRLGFDLSRVSFEPATKDYMQRYLDVDIALDTCPWPGGGTTCDALYMGVPVVSYYQERHSTRFTYSLLANIGLSDLASERMEDYVATAVALAGNLDLLDALHREMRDRMKASPVMDQERYIREMEECYRAIWAQWEAEQGCL